MILYISSSKDNTIENNTLSQSYNRGMFNQTWIMVESGSTSNSVARSLYDFDFTSYNSKLTNNVFQNSQVGYGQFNLYTLPVTSSVSIVDETLQFNPLTTAWIEGSSSVGGGKNKASNWLSSSELVGWNCAGATADTASVPSDYITTTKIFDDIRLTLSSSWLLNLSTSVYTGLMVRYTDTEESGSSDYWKTFYGRTTFNKLKQPAIYVYVDDDIQDDRNNVIVNTTSDLYFYNYNNNNSLENVTGGVTCSIYGYATSGSSGSILVSSSIATSSLTGIYYVSLVLTGTYSSASIYDLWKNSSGTLLGGFTSSIYAQSGKDNYYDPYMPYSYRTFTNIPDELDFNDIRTVRVYNYKTLNNFSRTGSLQETIAFNEIYYNVIDLETGYVFYDFSTYTRLSRDKNGNYFKFCFDALPYNREYQFKYKIVENNMNIIVNGPKFRTVYNEIF